MERNIFSIKMRKPVFQLAVVFFVFALTVTAQCPITFGETVDETKEDMAGSTIDALVLTGLRIPCSGTIYGWNVNATKNGEIKYFILRPSSTPWLYKIVYNETFNLVRGLNLFPNNRKHGIFSHNDTIAFQADITSIESINTSQSMLIAMSWHWHHDILNVTNTTKRFTRRFSVQAILQEQYESRFLDDKTSSLTIFKFHGVNIPIHFIQNATLGGNIVDARDYRICCDFCGCERCRSNSLAVCIRKNAALIKNQVIELRNYHYRFHTPIPRQLHLKYPVVWSWSNWSIWSNCTEWSNGGPIIPGKGTRNRTRDCIYLEQKTSVHNCYGLSTISEECEIPCASNFTANQTGGVLSCRSGTIIPSKNAKGKYLPNQNVTWTIERAVGEYIHFNLQIFSISFPSSTCGYDRLEIKDWSRYIGVFCGHDKNLTFSSCGNIVSIHFITNNKDNHKGFQLNYNTYSSSSRYEDYMKLTDDPPAYCVECGESFNSSVGTIQSRTSPLGSYLPNENCTWMIKGNPGKHIKISFKKFELDKDKDYLEISCGSIYSKIFKRYPEDQMVPCHEIMVRFVTDGSVQKAGFALQYNVLPPYPISPGPTETPGEEEETSSTTTTTTTTTATTTTTTTIGDAVTMEETTSTALISTEHPITTTTTTETKTTTGSTSTTTASAHTGNYQCRAKSWANWSIWSSCIGSAGSLYGYMKRNRICKQFPIQFNQSNCSLISTREGIETDKFSENASTMLPVCNSSSATFQDLKLTNRNSSKFEEFCPFPVHCDGANVHSRRCKYAKHCQHYLWSSWQPWSSCERFESQSRERLCNKVKYVIDKTSSCVLQISENKFCPKRSIYPSHYYYSGFVYSQENICNSKCIDNSSKFCKALSETVVPSNCAGTSKEVKSCFIEWNATNCYPNWASWGECSHSCGEATRTRYSFCESNKKFDEVNMESESCPSIPCAVDGAWTEWNAWSNCSKACVGGIQIRSRSCTNPPPSNGGFDCAGLNHESVGCNFFPCPVNGGFSQWTSWSYCSQPCGGGKITRYRQCNSPAPAYGGLSCQGNFKQSASCNNHLCKPARVQVSVKFTNETFAISMLYDNSTIFKEFSEKVKQNVLELYQDRKGLIRDIVIHGLSKGSVICNFSLLFNQSATDEIIILQNAVEDAGILNTMPTILLQLASTDASSTPASIKAVSHTATSITVSWSGFESSSNITGYTVFYKEWGTGSWKWLSTDQYSTQLELLMLKEYTLYTIRVAAFTWEGNGVSSSFVDCFTKEGVPDSAPINLICTVRSSTSIFVSSDPLNVNNWHSSSVGYITRYRPYNKLSDWLNSTNKIDPFFTIENLLPFTRYEVELAAVTNAGVGPYAWSQCITDEDVPASSPINLAASLLSRDGKINVTWDYLADDKANGNLKGYVIYYTVTRIGTTELSQKITNSKATTSYSNRVILSGFKPYTEVMITVSAFTDVGEGPQSSPVYVETCQCPKNIYVSWYSQKPYIHGDASQPSGLLVDIIMEATKEICQTCNGDKNHKFGSVNVFFNKTKNGKNGQFGSEKELKNKIDENAHYFLPIYGRENIDVFQKDFQFVLVAKKPGSVLLIKRKISQNLRERFLGLIYKMWPPVAITLLMGSIIGTILWLVERKKNPNELNIGSYVKGTLSGVWWSFITMTTVGYGDITPKSFLGKVIGMCWMLVGPVLNSMIIGVITSMITAIVTSKSTMLYGMKVAVVKDSFEYNLAIRRNAIVNQNVSYHNNTAVIHALETGVAQGALLDSLSAASVVNSLKEKQIEVTKFIRESHGFGIVLSPEIAPLKKNLQQFIDSKKKTILHTIKAYIKSIEVGGKSNTNENKSILSSIFSYGETFKMILIGLSVAIVAISIIALIIRCIFRCYKRKKVAPSDAPVIKKMKDIEVEISSTANELTSGIEKRFEELDQKHKNEMRNWFANNHYNFGILGLTKFGTMDEMRIKRKITLDDIMNADIKNYSSYKKLQSKSKANARAIVKHGPVYKNKTLALS